MGICPLKCKDSNAWLCGLLPRLVDDPVWPAGTASAAGDALAVLGALHQQMPGRWPVVAGGGRVVAGAAGGPAVEVRAAGPVLAARRGQHELAGDMTRWQAPP
jgi:hypothetical protein